MINTETLIEAIECSGEDWWTEFDDINEALEIITEAIKEKPDEDQIAILLSLVDHEENEFDGCRHLDVYRKCLRKMKKELKEKNNEFDD